MLGEHARWALIIGGVGGLMHGVSMHATTGTMWPQYLILSLVLGLIGGLLLYLIGFKKRMRLRTHLASSFIMGFLPATAYAFLAGSDNIPALVGVLFGAHTLLAGAILRMLGKIIQ